eukprot:14108201-Ditylum_brightwellii.AAC.1
MKNVEREEEMYYVVRASNGSGDNGGVGVQKPFVNDGEEQKIITSWIKDKEEGVSSSSCCRSPLNN